MENKITIYEGVYLTSFGELMEIELGEADDKQPAIRATGMGRSGTAVSTAVLLKDPAMSYLIPVIEASEYLGKV